MERYTPLSEVPPVHEALESTLVTWNFNLPPTIDTERLVINNRYISRLCKVAAFRAVHIGEYQGERTIFTPGINGMDARGNATASFAGSLQQAERQQSSIVDDYSVGEIGRDLMASHGKTRLTAALNKAEIVSRIVDARQDANVSRERAWADELNVAIGQSIREGARQHLVGREEHIMSKYWQRGYYLLTGGNIVTDLALRDQSMLPGVFIGLAALFVTMDEFALRRSYDKPLFDERRWSLTTMGAEQWDRYVAVQALSRTSSVIKVRE